MIYPSEPGFLLCKADILNCPCLAGDARPNGAARAQRAWGWTHSAPRWAVVTVGAPVCWALAWLGLWVVFGPQQRAIQYVLTKPRDTHRMGSTLECHTCAMGKQHTSESTWQDASPCFPSGLFLRDWSVYSW